MRMHDATPPHLEVFLRLGCCDELHGSLQFFALYGSVCGSPVVFFNIWTAEFESDSLVPGVAFRHDFGVPVWIFNGFLVILVIFGCRRVPGHPSGRYLASKSEKVQKNCKKGCQMDTFLGDFWEHWAHKLKKWLL